MLRCRSGSFLLSLSQILFITLKVKFTSDALQPGNGNVWFEGVHLLPLLRKVFSLPDGPETDLLQYLDRSVLTLTLQCVYVSQELGRRQTERKGSGLG